jgi:hypothetical protein
MLNLSDQVAPWLISLTSNCPYLQRLAKWFTTLSPKEKAKIIKDVTQLVLARRTRMCNFLEYKGADVLSRQISRLFSFAYCLLHPALLLLR